MIVYVLIIDHRHGRNVSIHETDVDANVEVANFAREWWETETSGYGGESAIMPSDPGQLVSEYFDASGEIWSVEECETPWLAK